LHLVSIALPYSETVPNAIGLLTHEFCLSVCPFLRLSVTFWHRIKTLTLSNVILHYVPPIRKLLIYRKTVQDRVMVIMDNWHVINRTM